MDTTFASAQAGPQNGVKGIRADAKRQSEAERDLERMSLTERNRQLETKSFQAQTHDEEDRDRRAEPVERTDDEIDAARQRDGDDVDNDDEAFKLQWRQRRLHEMKQQAGQDVGELNDDWKLERHRLREVGPEGFLKAVEGSGWTVVLLYEPVSAGGQLPRVLTELRLLQDLARCKPFLQAFIDLSTSSSPSTASFLKARATSLSFSLLPEGPDQDARSDPDVLPSVLVYQAGDLMESFIRLDSEVGKVQNADLAEELKRVFRRRVSKAASRFSNRIIIDTPL